MMLVWGQVPITNVIRNANGSHSLATSNGNQVPTVSVKKDISCLNQSKITHITSIFLLEYFRLKE